MQTVDPNFNIRSQGDFIPLTRGLRISFDKVWDDNITFARYDEAMYDDPEYLYSPSADNPIAFWDYYDYKDFTSRVVSMEWSREIEFPYSVSSAMADFTVNNFDDYFTPDSGSPIDQYILPKRPLRLLAGYQGVGTLQQFVGITEKTPIRDENSKTASFHALDFLSDIFNTELGSIIAMQNVTTDVVLEEIFKKFGLSDSSYVLAKGRNKIPFVFFDREKNAGNAIRELMQAEMGNLWIDEQGIIMFEPRLMVEQDPVFYFDDNNVIDITSTGEDEIINEVKIFSDIRAVNGFDVVSSNAREDGQPWFAGGDGFIISGGSSRPYIAELPDPCLSVVDPVLGQDTAPSWFTAVRSNGVPVTSGLTVTGTVLNSNNFVVFIQNTNGFPVEIDQMVLWGEPARVINRLAPFYAKDQDSIDKYESKLLEIRNDWFGSYDNADSFARTILDAYPEGDPVIEMSVKGTYALQLGDIVSVNARSYVGLYKITKIANVLNPYKCTIRARRYNPKNWGQYDVSKYNDSAVYAP